MAANRRYAENFGSRAELTMPPARHFAILTCMEARLDPSHFAGLAEGDAHVIRNAWGRASEDAIRSLVICYKLLGTREWLWGRVAINMTLLTELLRRVMFAEDAGEVSTLPL